MGHRWFYFSPAYCEIEVQSHALGNDLFLKSVTAIGLAGTYSGSHLLAVTVSSPVNYRSDAGDEIDRDIHFMKGYTVFNVEQVDGLPTPYYARFVNALPISERIAQADELLSASGAVIKHGGNRAYYSQSNDAIQLPPFEAFQDKESYYATALRELTHWTKHDTRLQRDFGRQRFGDAGYAREELVAELGAAFLCADLGITPEIREDHAAYIAHWLTILHEDKRAIFSAATHAQRATDYLNDLWQLRKTQAGGNAAA
jgi:antirestriction protein ArdC